MSGTFDLVIVGGGVCGASLYNLMTNYTDIGNVLLIDRAGTVNGISADAANSQTLHAGDIELNYPEMKAEEARRSVGMIVNYAANVGQHFPITYNLPKLLLGEGFEQCARLALHYHKVRHLYPHLKLLRYPSEIAELEPLAIKGRNPLDMVHALAVTGTATACSFEQLTNSLMTTAGRSGSGSLVAEVVSITRTSAERFAIATSDGNVIFAHSVVVNAGAEGLLLAQTLNDAPTVHRWTCVGINGSFFYAKGMELRSKLYMLPDNAQSFAPIHADCDVEDSNARFGPTAKISFKLNRRGANGFRKLSGQHLIRKYLWRLLKIAETRKYIALNYLYECGPIGRYLLWRQAKKLVPSLTAKQLIRSSSAGGLRAQVLDYNGNPVLGSMRLQPAAGLIFNVTVSPGATACLTLAERDMHSLISHLGLTFYWGRFEQALLQGPVTLPSYMPAL